MNPNDHPQYVQGHNVDPELEGAPLMGGGGSGGAVAYSINGGIVDHESSPRKRFSVATDGDVDAQVLDAGAEGGGRGLRNSIRDLGDSIKNMAKPDDKKAGEDAGTNPLFVLGVVCAFLLADAGKPITQKLGVIGLNAGVFANMNQLISVCIAFALTMIVVGPLAGLTEIFTWKTMKNYIMPTMFFSVSQLFYAVQASFLQPAQQKVLAQLRIPITAFMAKVIMGHGYTGLQWLMILSITIAVFEFQLLCNPNDGLLGDNMVGFIFSVLTNFAASSGSLAGEKTMKETKKQPFVLQKAQFAMWELLFGIGATVVIGPLTGILVDTMESTPGNVFERKRFVGQWPTSLRGAEWAISGKGALTNLQYQPKFANLVSDNGDWTKAKAAATSPKVVLKNKLDAGWWHTTSDQRDFSEISLFTGGDVIENETKAALQSFVKSRKYLKARKLSIDPRPLEKADGSLEKSDKFTYLGSLDAKFGVVPESDFKQIGKPIRNYFDGQLRDFDSAQGLILDTMWQGSAPFSLAATTKPASFLKNNFVLTIADPEPEKLEHGEYFRSFAPQRRDQPFEVADNMKHGIKTVEVKDGTKELKTVDGVFTSAHPDLTLHADFDSSKTYMNKMLEDLQKKFNADVVSKWVREDNKSALAELYTAANPIDMGKLKAACGDKKPEKPADDSACVTAIANEPNFQKLVGQDTNGPMGASVEYKWTRSTVYNEAGETDPIYNTQKGDVRVVYQRDATLKASTWKSLNDKKDGLKTVSGTFSKRMVMLYKVEADKELSFANGSFDAKKHEVTLVGDVKKEAKALDKVKASWPEAKKEDKKEESDDDKAIKDVETNMEAESAFTSDLCNDTGKAVGKPVYCLYQSEDELDQDNAKSQLFMNRLEFEARLTKADKKFTFWTYPGDKAGGAKDSAGNIGCTRKTCHMSGGEWDDNFGYVHSKIFWSPVMEGATAPAKKYSTPGDGDKLNPFFFSTFQSWTSFPMPWNMLNFWFLLAIVTNIGQNWMSALLSKTLSSLWKNIFAAVALAMIVMVQAVSMDPAIKSRQMDWSRLLMGTAGVLITSMIFSQAPKAPKPEPKKE